MTFQTLTHKDGASYLQKKEVADFLVDQLGSYGDPHEHIMNCLDYALDQAGGKGGFVVLAREDQQLLGAVVVNKTGMSGYIPENILVYLAVKASQRGKGLGTDLLQTAINLAQGGIALHVEPGNPAIKLYEKLGFTNKYLEMRLVK